MRLFSRVKKQFVFAALVLTLLLSGAFLPSSTGGWASVVSASVRAVRYSKEITYYNNAAHTTVVGTGMIYCNGSSTLDGTSTPYRTEEILDVCCGSVPC